LQKAQDESKQKAGGGLEALEGAKEAITDKAKK
jgi:hypothetical protein